MNKIVYFKPTDVENFDLDRFVKSLNNYAKVSKEDAEKALEDVSRYSTLHVSRLVEVGVNLIANFGSEEDAKKYYDDHADYFGQRFERLRRITGYLVGDLTRWNDGKRAEESQRVKHSVNSCVNDLVRAAKIQDQILAQNAAYAGKTE